MTKTERKLQTPIRPTRLLADRIIQIVKNTTRTIRCFDDDGFPAGNKSIEDWDEIRKRVERLLANTKVSSGD